MKTFNLLLLLLVGITINTLVVHSYPLECKTLKDVYGIQPVNQMLRAVAKYGSSADSNSACSYAKKCARVLEPFLETSTNGNLRLKSRCPKDCSKHGICVSGLCVCDSMSTGEDCSQAKCKDKCSGNGVCKSGSCECFPGFSGDNCGVKDECSMSCSNNGICKWGRCFCNTGFSGEDCSKPVNCPDDCSGKGVCSAGECFCMPGWKGTTCNTMVKECPKGKHGKLCSGHGKCNSLEGSCECDSGYSGKTCKPSDICRGAKSSHGEECSGNGICVLGRCHCLPGFTREDCSIGVGGCPHDCHGNGVCDTGVCRCNVGYEGESCENKIDLSDAYGPLIDSSVMKNILQSNKLNDGPKTEDDIRFVEVSGDHGGVCSLKNSWKAAVMSPVGLFALFSLIVLGGFLGFQYHRFRVSGRAAKFLKTMDE